MRTRRRRWRSMTMTTAERASRARYAFARKPRVAATEAIALPDDSDYGSDLDTDAEQLLDDLLSQAEAGAPKPFVLETIEDTVVATANAFIPKLSTSQSDVEEYFSAVEDQVEGPAIEIERYSEPEAATTQPRAPVFDGSRSVSVEPAAPEATDARSPLQRFRKPPLKALSVTDLVSPAWCELQYWYTLTKHGRKRRTPAMKQGSKVHKILEEQVHQVVPVDIQTREDGWGLRIWNVIQGVRTLRVTGMTRELEVWGVIDGQVVNGIIDELSFTCPDPELEADIIQKKQKDGGVGTSLPANQTSIEDFWTSSGAIPLDSSAWLGSPHPQRRVYLTDVKTRSSKTLPQSSALRPTKMQLMLYHFLLASIAANGVNADTIFSRYRLDATAPFSDSFIAEIGSLDFNFRNDSNEEDYAPFRTQEDSVLELLSHNSLSQLWSLMIAEFIKTLPSADAIGGVLKAEFRSQNNGAILGSKTFAYDDAELRAYVEDEMKWWRGERQARGVDIEEAYKCRICEFAEECEWRKSKIDEAMQKNRARQAASRT